jgi:gamma-glutamyltranspeptidase/glutathione hydrolase
MSLTEKVISEKGAVSFENPADVQAGLDILEKGGNAVDAMIAGSLVSNVTNTGNHSFGGYGGAMVIYMKKIGQPVVVDFNTRAPLAMFPEYFTSAAELAGYSYKTVTHGLLWLDSIQL